MYIIFFLNSSYVLIICLYQSNIVYRWVRECLHIYVHILLTTDRETARNPNCLTWPLKAPWKPSLGAPYYAYFWLHSKVALLPHCELRACTTCHLQGPPPIHGCTIPLAVHTRARVAPATIWSHGIVLGCTKEKKRVGGEDTLADVSSLFLGRVEVYVGVRVCIRTCTHSHPLHRWGTQMWIQELGWDTWRAHGGPEESKWNKSRHTCIRTFVQITHVYVYAKGQDEILD